MCKKVKKQNFVLWGAWTRPRDVRARPRVQVPVTKVYKKKQKPGHGGVFSEHGPCPVT
ncbi:hypothetical protein HanRHA438_Chr05g0229071 [Helianthus annuus]|nr:hypothetical protein HanRHA438_Chr05g0229071 [Helianthus annuus]